MDCQIFLLRFNKLTLGIRIVNKLLLEFFYGVDYFDDTGGLTALADGRIKGQSSVTYTTYGGRLKCKISEAIHLTTSVQREDYKSLAKIDYPDDSAIDDIINRNKTSALVSLFRFEYFW